MPSWVNSTHPCFRSCSLLAAPIILDLVLLAELTTRIKVKRDGDEEAQPFHPVAVLLSYLTKAPLVPPGTPVVNALAKQRAMLENVMRACIGLCAPTLFDCPGRFWLSRIGSPLKLRESAAIVSRL